MYDANTFVSAYESVPILNTPAYTLDEMLPVPIWFVALNAPVLGVALPIGVLLIEVNATGPPIVAISNPL
mgnify:CR=1 FL=1